MLAGVSGQAREIEAAINAFESFHSEPLLCSRASSGSLSCRAGQANLAEHLARHGFAGPARDSQLSDAGGDLVGVQTWVATLLGFAAAVAAFVFRARQDRLRDEEKREQQIVLLNKQRRGLQVALNRIVSHTSTEDMSNEARGSFKSLAKECCDYLEVFLADPTLIDDAEDLQQALRTAAKDVDNLQVSSDKSQLAGDLTGKFRNMVTALGA